jgi:hypothetical protein
MKSQKIRFQIYEALFILFCVVVLIGIAVLQFGLLGR